MTTPTILLAFVTPTLTDEAGGTVVAVETTFNSGDWGNSGGRGPAELVDAFINGIGGEVGVDGDKIGDMDGENFWDDWRGAVFTKEATPTGSPEGKLVEEEDEFVGSEFDLLCLSISSVSSSSSWTMLNKVAGIEPVRVTMTTGSAGGVSLETETTLFDWEAVVVAMGATDGVVGGTDEDGTFAGSENFLAPAGAERGGDWVSLLSEDEEPDCCCCSEELEGGTTSEYLFCPHTLLVTVLVVVAGVTALVPEEEEEDEGGRGGWPHGLEETLIAEAWETGAIGGGVARRGGADWSGGGTRFWMRGEARGGAEEGTLGRVTSSLSRVDVDKASSIISRAVETDLSVPLIVTNLSTDLGIALDMLIWAPDSLYKSHDSHMTWCNAHHTKNRNF